MVARGEKGREGEGEGKEEGGDGEAFLWWHSHGKLPTVL